LLLDEPAAGQVARVLAGEKAAIPTVQLAELIDQLERREGMSEAEVGRSLGAIMLGKVAVRPVVEAHAWRAADLRARYYRRRTRELSLADCLLLASAREGDRIATSDPAVAEVARAESIPLLPLPDSSGVMPA
jgi:predicted nucleic acid-binding protein